LAKRKARTPQENPKFRNQYRTYQIEWGTKRRGDRVITVSKVAFDWCAWRIMGTTKQSTHKQVHDTRITKRSAHTSTHTHTLTHKHTYRSNLTWPGVFKKKQREYTREYARMRVEALHFYENLH